MAEITLSTSNAIEIENPELLAGAVEELLYTPDLDALAVRGLATSYGMLAQTKRVTSIPLVEMIGRNIKYMRQVDRIVADFWEQGGYSNYALLAPNMLSSIQAKRGSSSRHTDYPATVVSELRGPLSMSIAAAGRSVYGIERPTESFRYEDGTFNILKWRQWKSSPAPVGPLRTYLEQASSDAVLFVNHPTQSYHEVEALEDNPMHRIAGLYDYRIIPTP